MPNKTGSQIKKLQAEARVLLDDHQVAALDESRLHPLHKFVHFWILVGRHFIRNRCLIRASALAYTTLLALIPLLAIGLSVSTSLLKNEPEQTEEMITRLIEQVAPQLENLPGTADEKLETRRKVVSQIQSFIANIHSGALGLTGTVAIVFVAIGLLSTIEATFNDIWGVQRGRNWFVRVIQYWAAITLGPLVIVLVMGLAIGSQFQAAQTFIRETPFIGSLVFKLMPFFALTGAFMLLYQLMPNTRVHWRAALIGGGVAAMLWIANGNSNALFASRVVSQSKIYGSLGAIPIFLLGLYLSWTILLFGAQVAYAFQNRRAYLQERQAASISQEGREYIALRLMTFIAGCYHRGESPPSGTQVSDALAVSSRLVSQILQPLLKSHLLVEVSTPETAYCPGRPLDRITCDDILQSLRSGNGCAPGTREGPERERIRQAFDEIRRSEAATAKSMTLQDLVTAVESPGTA